MTNRKMGDKSKIEWTDATWNPLRGCTRVSEGCRNCYAERVAARFSGPGQPYEGLAVMKASGARWTGEIEFVLDHLRDPLRWTKPRRIFVNSMSDLFHEKVSSDWIDRIFAVMALCPQHQFQCLTKRPERMLWYLSSPGCRSEIMECAEIEAFDEWTVKGRSGRLPPGAQYVSGVGISAIRLNIGWPLPNVWLGVSVEDQEAADERIPILLETSSAVHFVSYEPALGSIDLRRLRGGTVDALSGLDWVIAGGESGPRARPARPDWFRRVRDDCVAAHVPFFFKQWGEFLPYDQQEGRNTFMPSEMRAAGSDRVGKRAAGRLLDGREWSEFPKGYES